MAVSLPSEVRAVFGALGGMEWPEVDEDELWALAQVWFDSANEVEQFTDEVITVVGAALGAFEGTASEEFRAALVELVSGNPPVLGGLATGCRELGQYLYDVALNVQYSKWIIAAELLILALQIIYLIHLAIPTGGASLSAIPAIVAVGRHFAMRVICVLVKSIVFGVVIEVGMDAAVQIAQIIAGKRHSLDASMLANSSLSGVIGGVISAGFGLGRGVVGSQVRGRVATASWKLGSGSATGAAEGYLSDGFSGLATGSGWIADWRSATSGAAEGGVDGAGEVAGHYDGVDVLSAHHRSSDLSVDDLTTGNHGPQPSVGGDLASGSPAADAPTDGMVLSQGAPGAGQAEGSLSGAETSGNGLAGLGASDRQSTSQPLRSVAQSGSPVATVLHGETTSEGSSTGWPGSRNEVAGPATYPHRDGPAGVGSPSVGDRRVEAGGGNTSEASTPTGSQPSARNISGVLNNTDSSSSTRLGTTSHDAQRSSLVNRLERRVVETAPTGTAPSGTAPTGRTGTAPGTVSSPRSGVQPSAVQPSGGASSADVRAPFSASPGSGFWGHRLQSYVAATEAGSGDSTDSEGETGAPRSRSSVRASHNTTVPSVGERAANAVRDADNRYNVVQKKVAAVRADIAIVDDRHRLAAGSRGDGATALANGLDAVRTRLRDHSNRLESVLRLADDARNRARDAHHAAAWPGRTDPANPALTVDRSSGGRNLVSRRTQADTARADAPFARDREIARARTATEVASLADKAAVDGRARAHEAKQLLGPEFESQIRRSVSKANDAVARARAAAAEARTVSANLRPWETADEAVFLAQTANQQTGDALREAMTAYRNDLDSYQRADEPKRTLIPRRGLGQARLLTVAGRHGRSLSSLLAELDVPGNISAAVADAGIDSTDMRALLEGLVVASGDHGYRLRFEVSPEQWQQATALATDLPPGMKVKLSPFAMRSADSNYGRTGAKFFGLSASYPISPFLAAGLSLGSRTGRSREMNASSTIRTTAGPRGDGDRTVFKVDGVLTVESVDSAGPSRQIDITGSIDVPNESTVTDAMAQHDAREFGRAERIDVAADAGSLLSDSAAVLESIDTSAVVDAFRRSVGDEVPVGSQAFAQVSQFLSEGRALQFPTETAAGITSEVMVDRNGREFVVTVRLVAESIQAVGETPHYVEKRSLAKLNRRALTLRSNAGSLGLPVATLFKDVAPVSGFARLGFERESSRAIRAGVLGDFGRIIEFAGNVVRYKAVFNAQVEVSGLGERRISTAQAPANVLVPSADRSRFERAAEGGDTLQEGSPRSVSGYDSGRSGLADGERLPANIANGNGLGGAFIETLSGSSSIVDKLMSHLTPTLDRLDFREKVEVRRVFEAVFSPQSLVARQDELFGAGVSASIPVTNRILEPTGVLVAQRRKIIARVAATMDVGEIVKTGVSKDHSLSLRVLHKSTTGRIATDKTTWSFGANISGKGGKYAAKAGAAWAYNKKYGTTLEGQDGRHSEITFIDPSVSFEAPVNFDIDLVVENEKEPDDVSSRKKNDGESFRSLSPSRAFFWLPASMLVANSSTQTDLASGSIVRTVEPDVGLDNIIDVPGMGKLRAEIESLLDSAGINYNDAGGVLDMVTAQDNARSNLSEFIRPGGLTLQIQEEHHQIGTQRFSVASPAYTKRALRVELAIGELRSTGSPLEVAVIQGNNSTLRHEYGGERGHVVRKGVNFGIAGDGAGSVGVSNVGMPRAGTAESGASVGKIEAAVYRAKALMEPFTADVRATVTLTESTGMTGVGGSAPKRTVRTVELANGLSLLRERSDVAETVQVPTGLQEVVDSAKIPGSGYTRSLTPIGNLGDGRRFESSIEKSVRMRSRDSSLPVDWTRRETASGLRRKVEYWAGQLGAAIEHRIVNSNPLLRVRPDVNARPSGWSLNGQRTSLFPPVRSLDGPIRAAFSPAALKAKLSEMLAGGYSIPLRQTDGYFGQFESELILTAKRAGSYTFAGHDPAAGISGRSRGIDRVDNSRVKQNAVAMSGLGDGGAKGPVNGQAGFGITAAERSFGSEVGGTEYGGVIRDFIYEQGANTYVGTVELTVTLRTSRVPSVAVNHLSAGAFGEIVSRRSVGDSSSHPGSFRPREIALGRFMFEEAVLVPASTPSLRLEGVDLSTGNEPRTRVEVVGSDESTPNMPLVANSIDAVITDLSTDVVRELRERFFAELDFDTGPEKNKAKQLGRFSSDTGKSLRTLLNLGGLRQLLENAIAVPGGVTRDLGRSAAVWRSLDGKLRVAVTLSNPRGLGSQLGKITIRDVDVHQHFLGTETNASRSTFMPVNTERGASGVDAFSEAGFGALGFERGRTNASNQGVWSFQDTRSAVSGVFIETTADATISIEIDATSSWDGQKTVFQRTFKAANAVTVQMSPERADREGVVLTRERTRSGWYEPGERDRGHRSSLDGAIGARAVPSFKATTVVNVDGTALIAGDGTAERFAESLRGLVPDGNVLVLVGPGTAPFAVQLSNTLNRTVVFTDGIPRLEPKGVVATDGSWLWVNAGMETPIELVGRNLGVAIGAEPKFPPNWADPVPPVSITTERNGSAAPRQSEADGPPSGVPPIEVEEWRGQIAERLASPPPAPRPETSPESPPRVGRRSQTSVPRSASSRPHAVASSEPSRRRRRRLAPR